MPILDDTIAAIATAPGAGGLAVVRVSGARALAVADAVFRGAMRLADAPSHTLHHGWAVWPAAGAAEGPSVRDAEAAEPARVPADSDAEAAEPARGAPPGAEAAGSARGMLPAGRSVPHPAEPRSSSGELRRPWLPLALDAPPGASPARTPPAGADSAPLALDALPGAPPAQAPAVGADGAPLGLDAPPTGAVRLDEVVVAVFRSPRSYTREDVVEISCHGGELPSRRVLSALLAAGARLAGPGEFTLRAFLNGRIDLTQAEAVADLIQAGTEKAHALAVAQLSGELSRRLDALGERVADAVAEVEARVDFAEDVGGVEVPVHVVAAIGAVDDALAALLRDTAYARAVREGVRVPLVGRPNVGKSSLFNALLGESRAIVTAVPGTTRDRVSEAIELAGVRVTLSDTAGLRETDDAVEAIGVARTHEALAGAALALWVVDASAPLADEDRQIAEKLAGRRVLVALNKSDRVDRLGVHQDAPARAASGNPRCDYPRGKLLPEPMGRIEHARWPVTSANDVAALLDGARPPIVAVSATTGEGLDVLRAALAGLLGAGDGADGLGMAVGNLRHAEAIERARAALARAARAAADRLPGEIVALELREALAALGEVTGRAVDEDLLDRIFGKFCVGK